MNDYSSVKELNDRLGFDNVYEQDGLIDGVKYQKTIDLLRKFFNQKGFIEVPVQTRFSILAACEDPDTVECYTFKNIKWPLPQTGQMWLEYELLAYPERKGVYCITTSYRSEPNPVKGRHKMIFPMFEFESAGTFEDLMKLEKELVVFLGLAKDTSEVKDGKYEDIASELGVSEIDRNEEQAITDKYGKAFLLTEFPERTSPFFNMKMNGELSKKIDVIIEGHETIGSAERSADVKRMRDMFYTISEGTYAKKLYDLFGEERVNKELDDYLSLNFFERFGGGIGVTRLISALEKNNLI